MADNQKIGEYDKNYLLLPDVYAQGGPEVFKEYSRKKHGRNLIVLPIGIAEQLEVQDKKLERYGFGGRVALEELKQMDHETLGDHNVTLYHFNYGLDIAVLFNDSHGDFAITPSLVETIQSKFGKKPEIITTNSLNHIKCQSLELKVSPPDFLLADASVLELGMINAGKDFYVKLTENCGDDVRTSSIPLDVAKDILGEDLFMNQIIKMPNPDPQKSDRPIYARVTGDPELTHDNRLIRMKNERVQIHSKGLHELFIRDHKIDTVCGLRPRDDEQYFAIQDCILNPFIQAGIIVGGPSSGKTAISYNSVIETVLFYNKDIRKLRTGKFDEIKSGVYDKVVSIKPTIMMGGMEGLGYLKGNLWEKYYPYLLSYEDAHKLGTLRSIPFKQMFLHPDYPNHITNESGEKREVNPDINGAHFNPNHEVIELAFAGHARGRSFSRSIVLIDEFQNFTPYEGMALLTRPDNFSKTIVLGDLSQIDNPYCTKEYNALTYAVKHSLESPRTAVVKLSHCYRNDVADLFSKVRIYRK